MNPYAVILLLTGAALLQSSLLPHLSPGGLKPDLVVILVISWGLLRGVKEGLLWAFIGGLALDLLSTTPLGLSTLILTLLTFLTSLGQKSIYRTNILFPLALIFLATSGYNLALLLAWQLLGRPALWGETFQEVLLPTGFLNTLAMLPLYPLLSWLHRRIGPERMEW
ncbi:MAG TPA: rod shape-determining protein MreD [Chloroflexi bacterium]|nr:rod shape-determining protein MreD [Chloroflexota bacterium]